MVNSHANTVVFLLMAKIPNTHVKPNTGNNTMTDTTRVLKTTTTTTTTTNKNNNNKTMKNFIVTTRVK